MNFNPLESAFLPMLGITRYPMPASRQIKKIGRAGLHSPHELVAISTINEGQERMTVTPAPPTRPEKSALNFVLLKLTRHSLALLGLTCLAVLAIFASQPDLRLSASHTLLGWLESRQDTTAQASETGLLSDVLPVTNRPMVALSDEQEAVTKWLSRRYKISPEPLGALVSEAWTLGERMQVSPTLLLAVIAIESRFNPFASGSQGGMGLMQIEPDAQEKALLPFGGPLAAFDPLTNLRVGAQHLQSLIAQSTSVEAALQAYATASGQRNGEDYVNRVLGEQKHLDAMKRPAKPLEVAQNSRL